MRKPDASTFQEVCRIHDLSPSKTLFIDDSIQHIHGAQEAGLNTFFLEDIMKLSEIHSFLEV